MNQQNPRELRGLAIASNEDMISRINDATWRVRSQTNIEIAYTVIALFK